MRPVVSHLSDTSLLLTLARRVSPVENRRIHTLATRLAANPLAGVTEAVPAYASLAVHYDPLLVTAQAVRDWLLAHLDSAASQAATSPREHILPVHYNGPDLPFVAGHCGLSITEVIRLHTSTNYTVYMMGFSPGFPYLGLLPRALQTPRLATPRTHVPAGSVAIAGRQTGMYPIASPGGWQLIGQTSLPLLDATRDPPFLLAPSDTVRFVQDA